MKTRLLILLLLSAFTTMATAQTEPYFIQTFEDSIPDKDHVTEAPLRFQIEGQGEWIFFYSFKGTNTQYIKDGSKGCLRLPKKSSSDKPAPYVITPNFDKGVGHITFEEGRTKRSLLIFISKDNGQSWELKKEFAKATTAKNTVNINDPDVNRIKLEKQDTSGDCDIDNLTIWPYNPNGDNGGGESPEQDNGVIETFWCSPSGDDNTGDGSKDKPFRSLQLATDKAGAGDTINLLAGTYVYDTRIDISHCGKADKLITLRCPDGRAILDFSAMPYHQHSNNPQQGIRLTGSYWHFYRIDICHASDNGLLIERESSQGYPDYQAHDNLIEQCNFYKNGDTGLQMKNLASYNRVINCDSYLNCDEGQGDADGFAPKLSVGTGNYFYGCRAWLNSDDGWDAFYKSDSGQADDITIVLEDCIAYKNGFLSEEQIAPDGNGNGFKMGSNQGATNLYLTRCLAACNKAKGFDQNHNSGDIILNNCTGMSLKKYGDSKAYSYRIYEPVSTGHEVRVTNCLAINDRSTTDKKNKDGSWKEGENGKNGLYGRFEIDSTLTNYSILTSEFRYASPDQFVDTENHAELIAPRQADGSLPETTFAHLKDNATFIDKGTIVEATNYRGINVNAVNYNGEAPDLGAYEYGNSPSAIQEIYDIHLSPAIRLQQTMGGLVIISLGARSNQGPFDLTLTDLNGHQLKRHTFTGTTTAISLPLKVKGVLIISIKGKEGFSAVAKMGMNR